MVRILLSGCNGRMGRVISRCVQEREDCAIVAGIDRNPSMEDGFPVFENALECTVPADVIIDFSHPNALEMLLGLAVQQKLPIVVATTGYCEEQLEQMRLASKKTPVFHSANMSLGVNLLVSLAKKAARILGQEFDIEIIEKHHNQKIDAPSGTALLLADQISTALETPPQYVYDRHAKRQKRTKNEIGIHALRGGTIVGEHEVIFAGHDETITLAHSATSREVFATGAINAGLFMAKQTCGLYSMSDMLDTVE